MSTGFRFIACAVLLSAACGGEPSTSGLDQPFWLASGSFKSGDLPGSPPKDEPDSSGELRLTTIETNNSVLHPGQTGKRISGRATDDGYAVAVRFEGLGDGYWVKPLGEADSAYPGELSFSLSLELAHDLPLGPQRLLFSVVDAAGKGGRQQALEVCVTSRFDKALNACDDTQRPPAATISLHWNSAADLDLIVRTPDGELIDADHPSSAAEPEQRAVLYADRGESCSAGSSQSEDLVWLDEVPPGTYDVFVNLFDACGARATHFQLDAFARVQRDDETYRFRAAAESVLGELLADQANGGREDGFFITRVELP